MIFSKKLIKPAIGISIFGLGVFLGKQFEKFNNRKRTNYIGTLRIDQSEANEAPMLFLEVEVPLETLDKSETAIFKIVRKNYLSH